MKKLLILGSTGMLGNALRKYFEQSDGYDLTVTYNNKKPESGNFKSYHYNALENWKFNQFDYIINCIGIIKPNVNKDKIAAIIANSILPHKLCNTDVKLIHISTDCVYSGNKGGYVESDPHDALDFYGKSKSLGEPENCMVLRTSIIGDEEYDHVSLVSWVKSIKGKNVKGYINHYWNGITTREYAVICDKIMYEGLYEHGLFHVFSNIVSKYEMLCAFNEKWNLNLNIESFVAEPVIDRTLATTKQLNSILEIPSFEQMVKEM